MPEPSARSSTAVVEPSSSVVRLAGAAPELPQLPDPAEADDLGRTAREYVTGARERLRTWHDAGAAGFGLGSSLYKPGDDAATVAKKAAAIVAAWKALT